MNHDDHVALIAPGVAPGGVWADLGSGTGAFTLALRDLAGPTAEIVSIDRDPRALAEQRRAFARRFPDALVRFVAVDFTRPLDLPSLDGLLAANSLHYVPDAEKPPLLRRLRAHLKPGGRLIVVEYDTDEGNRWVPHPFSYPTFAELAEGAGFREPTLLATHPSRFLGRIYAAMATAPAAATVQRDRL